MAEIKFTKNELRAQEKKLGQLKKYLPTLQLKKAMLQAEIYEARLEIDHCEKELQKQRGKAEEFSPLLSARLSLNLKDVARIDKVEKRYDNIAGVEVPYFESISFHKVEYGLFDTPAWVDAAVILLRKLAEGKVRVMVAEEKKGALEEELRMVSIRVNLFEKILIPRAQGNIKKIKVFLGDQELAAVSRAKVAKQKIEQKKTQLAT
ncbi:V-type ATP synthase subunit D [Waddlia chondrophila 2032/99]|uniref:V-type ATP synthase subunit D n=2 Tax=Waddlia chondrophila TaxID=71667 RepID=D6YV14_WADCW|nr:V-type ATP synthase subunit D [Waddlia chondrophila]ADI37975.1 V-type ATP synthase, subunit D [Waddlia chondrophila WSU 86-1044]CCB91884.1 V-type ATP synthase subunit D [Waddlia chondrophila 2032/99]